MLITSNCLSYREANWDLPHTYGLTVSIDHLLQTISIFSATIPEEVERLVRTVQKEVVRVTVGSRNATASSVKQRLQYVGSEEGRFLMLQSLFRTGIDAPVLIFVSSSEAAGILQRYLLPHSIPRSHRDNKGLIKHAFCRSESDGQNYMFSKTLQSSSLSAWLAYFPTP